MTGRLKKPVVRKNRAGHNGRAGREHRASGFVFNAISGGRFLIYVVTNNDRMHTCKSAFEKED
jgi:hypothetical protein